MPSLRARCSQLCLNATYLSALCLVLALCFVPARVFAQGTGGRVLGRITDPSGAVLSNAKVTATNDATGVSHDALSNDSGDYAFPDLPVGTYSLTFDLTGFKKSIRHGHRTRCEPGHHAQHDDAVGRDPGSRGRDV
jgi:hypothetical protein